MLTTREGVEATGKQGLRVVDSEFGPKCWTLDRFWMLTDSDDLGFAPHAQNDGYWEAWITAWLARELTPETCFIDVGANHGYYSLLAASMGCDVLAFEPQAKLAMLLAQSIAANGFRDKLKVRIAAAGDRWGPIDMIVPHGHGMNASVSYTPESPHGYTKMRVAMMPLDYFAPMFTQAPMLIKIDAEGAEPIVWAGMQKLLARKTPTMVLLEYRWDRYADPMAFAEALFDAGEVSFIGTDSEEYHVLGPDMLAQRQHEDWMLVIRPKAHVS